MIQPNKKKAHPASSKTQVVLIEKSQIDNPKLDQDMEKILSNIIEGIKNSPPAQPRKKYQKGSGDNHSSLGSSKKLVGASNSNSSFDINSNLDPHLLAQLQTNQFQDSKLPSEDLFNQLLGSNDSQSGGKQTKIHLPISEKNNQFDENKSLKTHHTNQSQNQTPVTKQLSTNLTQKSSQISNPAKGLSKSVQGSNQDQSESRKRLRPKEYHKIQTAAYSTKKFVSDSLNPKMKRDKIINLDSEEEIVEINVATNQKKKTELELIMRYDEKKVSPLLDDILIERQKSQTSCKDLESSPQNDKERTRERGVNGVQDQKKA